MKKVNWVQEDFMNELNLDEVGQDELPSKLVFVSEELTDEEDLTTVKVYLFRRADGTYFAEIVKEYKTEDGVKNVFKSLERENAQVLIAQLYDYLIDAGEYVDDEYAV